MARKRLSDLLREEEQKGEDQSTSETSTSEVIENASTEPAPDPAASTVAVTAEVIAAPTDPTGDAGLELRNAAVEPPTPETDNSQHSPTQADFEGAIEQLKAELKSLRQTSEAAQTQEATLQAQIDHLKAEITAQQGTIQKLQAEADQSEQLKTELETAKQLILKLSQPSPQGNKATAKLAPSVIAPKAVEPELESKPVQSSVPPAKAAASERPKIHQMALRKVLEHPTQAGSLPAMPSERKIIDTEVKLSDTDVGWMD